MNLDIIGTIYEPAECTVNEVTSEISVSEPIALIGWHVNSSEEIEQWSEFRVNPSSPRRIFAGGVKSYCYAFKSEEHFNEQLDLMNEAATEV